MDGLDRQKHWFETLIDFVDTPLYVAKNKLDSGKFRPGPQSFVGKLRLPYDHRTIGSNEVVIELDAPSFSQNSKYAKQIINYCVAQAIPYYAFWSGNKSIHIHFFLKLEVNSKEGKEVIKKAILDGFNIFKEIRLKFARMLVEQSGLNPSIIGTGKIVDLQKLAWDDIGGKMTLIRAEGGANKKIDKIDPTIITGGYKTYLKTIPDIKPRDNNFEDVEYPDKLEYVVINEGELILLAHNFNEEIKKIPKKEKKINFKGQFINTPCVQKVIEGMDSGKRSFGASLISLAAKLDGQDKSDAEKILDAFIKNCSQIPETFTLEEAKKWLDWVYKQPNPFWTCAHAIKLGVCAKEDCAYHKDRFKEELSVLDVNEPLNIIKEALDRMVIGEDSAKMQLFLLYLTKDLSGSPEWCILIDGPASSGKTWMMKCVASLFGEEDEEYFVYSRITASALNHIEELAKNWMGKIVIIEELQGSSDVVEQLRVAISEGKLTLLRSKEIRTEEGKDFVTEPRIVHFSNLFVTCNAEEYDEGDQLLSRAWIINTDTSQEQTKGITEFYLDIFNGNKQLFVPNLDAIRTALRFLEKPKSIFFPFADKMKGWLPTNSVRARRDIKKVIALIKASAYFHQRKRNWYEKDGLRYLVADWRDVEIAFRIAGEAINASTQGLGSKDIVDWWIVKDQALKASKDTFTIGDMCRWLKVNTGSARRKASIFMNMGLLENNTAPPLPAVYSFTALEIDSMMMDGIQKTCKEEMLDQDKKIKDWIDKNGGKLL